MKGIIKNGLYNLIGKSVIGEASSSVQDQKLDKIKLWRLRLGHIGQKGLKEIKNQGLLEKDK